MSAKPATIDLCRTRGDTFSDLFTVKIATVAQDITGATLLMTVDPEADPTSAANNLFQLTGVITDGPGGVFTMTPSAVQADQVPNIYFYDIQMTEAGGAIRTVAKGQYEILQDITK